MTWQRVFAAGALLAALAIAAGAFGAHALEKRLDADRMAVFETGARYHMYGALAVMALALAAAHGLRTEAPAWTVAAGTAVFAATLYALAGGAPRWLGAITPIGGTAMLLGLGWAAVAAFGAR